MPYFPNIHFNIFHAMSPTLSLSFRICDKYFVNFLILPSHFFLSVRPPHLPIPAVDTLAMWDEEHTVLMSLLLCFRSSNVSTLSLKRPHCMFFSFKRKGFTST
jgi:hypothetical protein